MSTRHAVLQFPVSRPCDFKEFFMRASGGCCVSISTLFFSVRLGQSSRLSKVSQVSASPSVFTVLAELRSTSSQSAKSKGYRVENSV